MLLYRCPLVYYKLAYTVHDVLHLSTRYYIASLRNYDFDIAQYIFNTATSKLRNLTSPEAATPVQAPAVKCCSGWIWQSAQHYRAGGRFAMRKIIFQDIYCVD